MSDLNKEQAERDEESLSSEVLGQTEDGESAEDVENAEDTEDTEDNEKETESNSLLRELLSWVSIFIGAFIIAYILTHFVIVNARIPSGSMKSTINEGDRVVGFRLSYKFEEPERGDIVMFNSPVEPGKIYIKRLIGLPGDEIRIENNKTYINGELLEEDYLKMGWLNNPGETTYVVPEGYYFMMGDNRDGSSDSRAWGYVAEEEIIAKAIFRYYPEITSLD